MVKALKSLHELKILHRDIKVNKTNLCSKLKIKRVQIYS